MGWLEDRVVQYLYSDGAEEIILEAKASEEVPAAPKGFQYKGLVPEKHLWMTKISFERNGRIGYEIRTGDRSSKPITRSATRERYEHMVGNTGATEHKRAKERGQGVDYNKSVYTKPYQQFVEKAEKTKLQTHERNLKKIMKGEK